MAIFKMRGGFSLKTFRQLVTLTSRHRSVFFQGIAMMALGVATSLVEPRVFGWVIDDAILPKRMDFLWGFGIGFLSLTALRVYATWQQNYLFEVLGQRVTHDLRQQVYAHILRLPVSHFDRQSTGSLMTRVTNDVSVINQMFSSGFVLMFTNAALVLGILVWLLLLDFKLGLIAISVFPVLVGASVTFSRNLRRAYGRTRARLSALNAYLAENLSGMKVIQLFNHEKASLSRFDRYNEEFTQAQVGTIRVFAYFQPLLTIGAGVSIALVIWFGGLRALDGSLKLGILVAFFSYVVSMFQPLREIADKWNAFLSGMTSADRIFSILSMETEKSDGAVVSEGERGGTRGHIVFENVWFAYEGEKWILRDFSLEIRPGEKIGIIGRSGAGKSSLISLLLRFYEPQKGRIPLDGVDIRNLSLSHLRTRIGVVQQEPSLFSGTFEENVTLWGQTPGARQILESLAFDVQRVGQKGCIADGNSCLSVGERQILGFARVAALNPGIWILDEATSNMDSIQEQKLQDALFAASVGKTGIFIAHRLSTLRSVDRIIMVRNGAPIEVGSHAQLMSSGGPYFDQAQNEDGPELALGP